MEKTFIHLLHQELLTFKLEKKMKTIAMSVILLVLSMAVTTLAVGSAEVKRVCTVDEKTKKEVCKNVKTHKKVEGTPVPEKPARK